MVKNIQRCQEIIDRDQAVISPGARRPYFPLVVEGGYGVNVRDADGNEYIDFLSNAAVNNVGHAHPMVLSAIQEQAKRLIINNPGYSYSEISGIVARELIRITPGNFPKLVSFGLSGSDCNDGAIQLVRCYTGRPKIISFLRSFHGLTYGALSLSGLNSKTVRGAGPLLPEVYHIPFPDCYRCFFHLRHPECEFACIAYLEELFRTIIPPSEVAAIIFEPIQGDSGVIVPPDNYYSALREICDKHGILMVAEEVLTGFARTGEWFATQHWSIEPDVILLGKAIASGMPLAAIIAREDIMQACGDAFWHAFTFGGNPISCAASLATIKVIEEEDLAEKSKEMGNYLLKRFDDLKEKYELIGDIRGKGLMIGLDLVKDRNTKEPAVEKAAKICWRCWEKGLILTFFGSSVLRIEPPLIISQEEIDRALTILQEGIEDVEANKVPDEVLSRIKGWGHL